MAGDLTTLANVKAWVNIPTATTTDDALLIRLITAASAFLLNWLNRPILTATYTAESYNGNGSAGLKLKAWPITAVSAVAVSGKSISASPDGIAGGYIFDDQFIYLIGSGQFAKGIRNITVTYVAGYAATPPDVEQACIELVSLKYRERSRIGLQSQSLQGQGTTSYTPRDLGKDTKEMLQNYRKVVPA